MVSVSDMKFEGMAPKGVAWALVGAIMYAVYLVGLRRKVDHEDKLDIPLFFGKLLYSNYNVVVLFYFIWYFCFVNSLGISLYKDKVVFNDAV